MPDLYNLPESRRTRPSGPRVTLLTVVGVLFLGFMLVNVGLTIVDSQKQLDGLQLEDGDRIEYHYTVTSEEGTLLDTTIYNVAQRAQQKEGFAAGEEADYGPQRATLDPANPGLGWGAEVEQAVLNSTVGRMVRVTTAGTEDWEPFPPDGLQRMLGPEPFQRTIFLQEPAAAEQEGREGNQQFSLDELEQAIGPVENGTVFNADQVFPPSWDIVFEDVNRGNRSVLFRHTVQDGEFFDVEGIPGGVTVVLSEDETQLHYRVDFEEGAIFTIGGEDPLLQAGFQPGSYHVEQVTEERVSLMYHESMEPETIGRPVTVEIRILNKV